MTIAEQLRQEGKHIGYQEGIHAGMQQGEHEKAIAIAKNMLAERTDINFIKKVTGLTEQDLSKLAKTH